MSTHTLYSASSLERLAICPASARMSAGIESTTSAAAERGTRIHALAEATLLGQPIDNTADMDELAVAQQYVEFIEDLVGDGELHVEVSVTESLKMYNEHFGGTADAVIVHKGRMDVVDLKTGSAAVSPSDNKQLLTYALGALNKFGWTGIQAVRLHIWQPSNIGSVEYSIKRMKEWEAELVKIGQRADDPFAKPVPSAKGCFYCAGKVKCEAIKEKALESAKQDFSENELEKLLDEAELAIQWGEFIRDTAKKRLAEGENGGKWYLRSGRKMTSWADQFAVEDFYADKPQAFEIKSPAAIKKLGYDIPSHLISTKESAPSLAKRDEDLK
jgi:hypothetical protein